MGKTQLYQHATNKRSKQPAETNNKTGTYKVKKHKQHRENQNKTRPHTHS